MLRLALLLTALGSLALRPLPAWAGNTTDALRGTWVVTGSTCNGCRSGPQPELGERIEIAAGGMKNPFGVNCATGAALESRDRVPVGTLMREHHLPPNWIPAAFRQGMAEQVRLTCDGIDNGTLFVVGGRLAIMPYEGGMIFRLESAD